MNSNKYLKYVIPLLAMLLMAGVGLYFKSFRTSDTPRHWLADIQYSHIAVTESYQKGEGSLLEPQSFNLNTKEAYTNGVTEARFPILNYIIGNTTSSLDQQLVGWRSISFTFFLIAVAVSVLIMFELTKNWFISFITGLMVNFTSVVLFAQHAIGPYLLTYLSILLSIYFVVLHKGYHKKMLLTASVFFAGWAMLQGHGSILFFVAVWSYYITYKLKTKEKINYSFILISIVFLGLFFYQRIILLPQNGGLFELNTPFHEGISGFFKSNAQYLRINSYGVSNTFLSISIFLGIIYALYLLYQRSYHSIKITALGIFCTTILTLNIIYYFMYVSSLMKYDFYSLEAMTPSLVLMSMFILAKLFEELKDKKLYFGLALSCISLISMSSTFVGYQKRFAVIKGDRVQTTLNDLEFADEFLDSLNISLDENILFINHSEGNLPMIMSGRKGYAVNGMTQEDLIEVLDHKDSKYILSQDQFFMYDIVNVYPDILKRLKLISTNETLSLYEKREIKDSQKDDVLINYMECHDIKGFHEVFNGFDNLVQKDNYGIWKTSSDILNDNGYSNNSSLNIKKHNLFPCTYEISLDQFDEIPTGAIITSMFKSDTKLNKTCFFLSCQDGNGDYYSNFFDASKKITEKNKWQRVSCKIPFPEKTNKEEIVKIFIWNPGQSELLVDDFSFVFY